MRKDLLPFFALALSCGVTGALMVRSDLMDPYDPAVFAAHPYGHNSEGTLHEGIAITLIELAIVSLLARPWTTSGRPALRAAGTLVLLTPWTLFSLFLCMHAGGIIAMHFLWLCVVDLIVLVVAIRGALTPASSP